MPSGVAGVIGSRDGLQFCNPQKSWDAWCLLNTPFCCPSSPDCRGAVLPFVPSLRL